MTTEWGALAGVFPVDDVLIEWLRDRADELCKDKRHPRMNHQAIDELESNILVPDADAKYTATIELDLSTVHPHVSGPNDVKKAESVLELEKQNIAIHKAYLISCTNSRFSDIQAAAQILRGKKVKEGVEFYVAPASLSVQSQAEQSGDWQILLDAGAKPLPAGCGPCIGLGQGLLKDGDVGISTSNRNFKGRMGSPKAFAYLASPAVVAASAVAGKITSPLSLDTPLSVLPLCHKIH
jgi:homoaconitate hydratase